MHNHILYEQSDHVGIITLNRPEAKNALTNEMLNDLAKILGRLEMEHEIRALMITGNGEAFCAGIDLVELEADHARISSDSAKQHLRAIQGITRKLIGLPFPTIAALNGLAVGMGSELTLSCDIRLASPDTYVWFSEARRGLFQTNGVLYLLPRLIGHSRSMEWMLSARKIECPELLESGLVSHVFPAEDFHGQAKAYVEDLARNSPLSLRLLKQTGFRAMEASFEEVLDLEIHGMQTCIQSEYLTEGLNAFREKREPEF
jgi:enoyl-CoA hydratase/carnithine racemase